MIFSLANNDFVEYYRITVVSVKIVNDKDNVIIYNLRI